MKCDIVQLAYCSLFWYTTIRMKLPSYETIKWIGFCTWLWDFFGLIALTLPVTIDGKFSRLPEMDILGRIGLGFNRKLVFDARSIDWNAYHERWSCFFEDRLKAIDVYRLKITSQFISYQYLQLANTTYMGCELWAHSQNNMSKFTACFWYMCERLLFIKANCVFYLGLEREERDENRWGLKLHLHDPHSYDIN